MISELSQLTSEQRSIILALQNSTVKNGASPTIKDLILAVDFSLDLPMAKIESLLKKAGITFIEKSE